MDTNYSLNDSPQNEAGTRKRGVSFGSETDGVGKAQITSIHTKSRLPNYPGGSIVKRFKVPDEQVLWEVCLLYYCWFACLAFLACFLRTLLAFAH